MNGTFILAAGRCDVTRPRRAALEIRLKKGLFVFKVLKSMETVQELV